MAQFQDCCRLTERFVSHVTFFLRKPWNKRRQGPVCVVWIKLKCLIGQRVRILNLQRRNIFNHLDSYRNTEHAHGKNQLAVTIKLDSHYVLGSTQEKKFQCYFRHTILGIADSRPHFSMGNNWNNAVWSCAWNLGIHNRYYVPRRSLIVVTVR